MMIAWTLDSFGFIHQSFQDENFIRAVIRELIRRSSIGLSHVNLDPAVVPFLLKAISMVWRVALT